MRLTELCGEAVAWMKLSELRPGMEHVDIKVKINRLEAPREVKTSYGAEHILIEEPVVQRRGEGPELSQIVASVRIDGAVQVALIQLLIKGVTHVVEGEPAPSPHVEKLLVPVLHAGFHRIPPDIALVLFLVDELRPRGVGDVVVEGDLRPNGPDGPPEVHSPIGGPSLPTVHRHYRLNPSPINGPGLDDIVQRVGETEVGEEIQVETPCGRLFPNSRGCLSRRMRFL